MSARRVAWLLAAALAVIAFAIWLSSQRHLERATLAGDLVLPGLEHSVSTVTQVRLKKGDGTSTTLQRADSGWNVTERSWPADLTRVRRLLLNLGALNVVEEKTRMPAYYPAIGVEDVNSAKAAGTEVTIVSPARTWGLIVGKPSGAKSGYVRVSGAAQSLLAAPQLTVDAAPKDWLDHTLIDLPAERVREIEEHPADGAAFTVAKQKKEDAHYSLTPLPRGRELSAAGAADTLAAGLSGVTLDDVSKGASAPAGVTSARALFRTFDGLEIEATGRKDGARALLTLAARSTQPGSAAEAQKLNARLSGWEFEIPDYKYAAIFVPVTELLKPLPEPKKPAAKTPAGARTPSTPPGG